MTFYDDYEQRCRGGSDIVGHLPYLYQRAAHLGHKIIELGVRSGESTCAFLAAAAAHGGHVWSVDVDVPTVSPEWFGDPHWTFIHGDDLAVADTLPPACDVLFIDTSHRYQHTLEELYLYGPRVKAGGVILLHDVDLESAPMSTAAEDRGFPVRRAVNDWCATADLTPTFRDGWYGLGVIEVG